MKTSTKFDLDSKGKKSNFDELVYEGLIQKTLEADSLCYVEGARPKHQPSFLSRHQFKVEYAKRENWENFSSGDYHEAMIEQFETRDDRDLNNPGMFEKNTYFDRIFPGLKIQKPGYDLYGSSTVVLGIIGAFIFMYFGSYSFTQ